MVNKNLLKPTNKHEAAKQSKIDVINKPEAEIC